ncbi:MAG: isochorismatase family protein [Chloroflexota bacterium]|nr:isochorismatase family protein [Chloroflexota bacterium]
MTRQPSPELLQRDRSALIVIDMQERLMPAIAEADAVTRAAGILIEAARHLEVPVVVTEQYPRGLGATVDAIAGRLPNDAAVVEKMTFSAARNHDFGSLIDAFKAGGRDHMVICGVESHVCVMQTAADLDAEGCTVHIVADACGSRAPASKDAALARFGALGISRVTTEMALFEWLEVAGTPEFKAVSRLVK